MTYSAKFGTGNKSPRFGAAKPKIQPAIKQTHNHAEDTSALYQKFAQEVSANTASTKTPRHASKANWAFFIACLYTFFSAQLLMAPYTLFEFGFAEFPQRMTDNFMASIIMARYIFMLSFIAKLLGKVSTRMDMAPRDTYIINGLLLSLIMAVGEVVTGNAIQPLSYCFFIAGGFGGYMFWHSRGCPTKA